jgi:hypothetical protein
MASLLWEPLGRFGVTRLFAPALLFAALPAGHAVTEVLGCARRWTGWGGLVLLPTALVGLVWFALPGAAAEWLHRLHTPQALLIGLGDERGTLLEEIETHTTPDARILWEDRTGTRLSPRWTALLPILTDRAYIGGLDPEAGIEHTASGLIDQTLAGRPLRDWNSADLKDYCKRYNIGWVVCWSPEVREKYAPETDLETPLIALGEDGDGYLLKLKRKPSFALRGSAKWLAADSQRIILEDVRPEDGQVLLSLHYQAGLRVTPSRVQLRRAQDKDDRVDFVRLLISDAAVTRITITWEKRLAEDAAEEQLPPSR